MEKLSIDDLLQEALASTAAEVKRLTQEIDSCDKTRVGCYAVGITEASKSIADAFKQRRNDARDELDATLRDLTDLRFHVAVEPVDARRILTPSKSIFYPHEIKLADLASASLTDAQLEQFALAAAGRLGATAGRPSVPELDKKYHQALERRKTLVLDLKKAQVALNGLQSAMRSIEPAALPEFGTQIGTFVALLPGQKMPPGYRLSHGQGDGPTVTIDY